MNDEEEQPDQNAPNIPVEFLVEFNDFVQDHQKNWANKKEDEMKIQMLFLFRPFSGLFVKFVIEIWIQNNSAYMSFTHSLI